MQRAWNVHMMLTIITKIFAMKTVKQVVLYSHMNMWRSRLRGLSKGGLYRRIESN